MNKELLNVEINRICRICLKSHTNMISLFAKIDKTSAFEKLITNTNLKIDVDDSGPHLICGYCLNELNILVKFLEKCKISNDLFSQINLTTKNTDVNLCDYSDLNLLNPEETSDREEDFGITDLKKNHYNICGDSIKKSADSYSCQYCKKSFTRKFNLTAHIRRHRGEIVRPQRVNPRQSCSSCNKSFTSATNLATHLRTHTGERPFVCTECGKTFRSKNTLRDHIKIHTGEKRYMCPQCGKRFTTNKLAAHSRSHGRPGSGAGQRGGERAHACRACPATYRHRQSLNRHLRRRHAHST